MGDTKDQNSRNVKISPDDYKDKGHGEVPHKAPSSSQGKGASVGTGPIDGAEGESYGTDSNRAEGQFGVTDRRH